MNARNNLYRNSHVDCPCGSPVRDRYVKDTTEYPPKLRKVGTTDQQALIQSFADECDVNRIVARYEAGDFSALSRVQGLYTDCTQYPHEPIEALNLSVKVNQMWDSLTPEDKAKFGTQEAFIDALVNSLDNPVSPSVANPAPFESNPTEGGNAE